LKILFVMIRDENIDPLGIQLLSALAKEEGHETFLNVLEHGDLDRDLKTIRPDVIAYSAKTGESNTFLPGSTATCVRRGATGSSRSWAARIPLQLPRMRLEGRTSVRGSTGTEAARDPPPSRKPGSTTWRWGGGRLLARLLGLSRGRSHPTRSRAS